LDNYVRQLVELTTNDDIVLITAEHGIDTNGFHVDRTEFVIDTPFVLSGPRINKGGPKEILQIDLAPTLSLLAGVIFLAWGSGKGIYMIQEVVCSEFRNRFNTPAAYLVRSPGRDEGWPSGRPWALPDAFGGGESFRGGG